MLNEKCSVSKRRNRTWFMLSCTKKLWTCNKSPGQTMTYLCWGITSFTWQLDWEESRTLVQWVDPSLLRLPGALRTVESHEWDNAAVSDSSGGRALARTEEPAAQLLRCWWSTTEQGSCKWWRCRRAAGSKKKNKKDHHESAGLTSIIVLKFKIKGQSTTPHWVILKKHAILSVGSLQKCTKLILPWLILRG